MPRPLYLLNEGLAFFIELAALGALAWWGARTGGGLAVHLLLGIGAPLAMAVVWGLYAAPKARVKLPTAGVLAVKALVFASAAVALYAIGHHGLGIGFAVVAFVNTAVATAGRASGERDHQPVADGGEA